MFYFRFNEKNYRDLSFLLPALVSKLRRDGSAEYEVRRDEDLIHAVTLYVEDGELRSNVPLSDPIFRTIEAAFEDFYKLFS